MSIHICHVAAFNWVPDILITKCGHHWTVRIAYRQSVSMLFCPSVCMSMWVQFLEKACGKMTYNRPSIHPSISIVSFYTFSIRYMQSNLNFCWFLFFLFTWFCSFIIVQYSRYHYWKRHRLKWPPTDASSFTKGWGAAQF